MVVATAIGISGMLWTNQASAQVGGLLGGTGGVGGVVGGVTGGLGGIGVPTIGPNIGPSIGPSIGGTGPGLNLGPTLGPTVGSVTHDVSGLTNGALNSATNTLNGATGQLNTGFAGQTVNSLSNGNLMSTANAASHAALGVVFGQGTTISNVLNNSAAWAAGLRPGDQILGINGMQITNPQQLTNYLQNLAPNQQVQLLVNRNGLTQSIGATLGTAQVFNQVNGLSRAVNADVNNTVGQVRNTINGVNAQVGANANGGLGAQIGANGTQLGAGIDSSGALGLSFTNGLQVSQILPNTQAFISNLHVGDQIVSLNGTHLSSPQDLINNLMTVGPNQNVDLTVIRNGQPIHVGAQVNTNALINEVNRTVHQGLNTVQGTVNNAQQFANNTVNNAQRTVNNTVDNAQRTANNAINTAQQTANNAVNDVNRTANNVTSEANRTLQNTTNFANQAANNALNMANGQIQGAERTANQALNNVDQTVRNTNINAADQFGAQTVNSLSGGALQSATNAANHAALGVLLGNGMQIANVLDNSAASAAGLRPGDQILGINGVRLDNPQMLTNYLSNLAPNQQVQLIINRNGLTQVVSATLGTGEVFNQVNQLGQAVNADVNNTVGQVRNTVNGINAQVGAGANGGFGATVNGLNSRVSANVDPRATIGLSLGNGLNGLQVNQILPNTQAFLHGLRVGDQIVSLNGTHIATPQQLINNLLTVGPNQNIDLTVLRNGQLVHVGGVVDTNALQNALNLNHALTR
jgi:S1-C subfamily serine protease